MIKITIDGIETEVPENMTVLEAAKSVGIDIPTLCFLKDINEVGDCRMCLVEVEGARGFVPSCMQKVTDGMVVRTNTEEVNEARKNVLELILSAHEKKCLSCIRNENCELQDLAKKFGITDVEFEGAINNKQIDDKSTSIVRNTAKCVLCRRCTATCQKVQEIGAIECVNRGFDSTISTVGNKSLADVNCTFCGQCIQNCPTAALHEKENIDEVWEKLKDENTVVLVQTAPAVRVALGEEFGMSIGTNVQGKMVTALKRLGFNKVFDTNTGADFTIMEEASEFINRVLNADEKKPLPMFTSCCPAWIRFIEMEYPEYLANVSSCKSPHQMFGAILKTYYAEKNNIDPNKIYVVSVMPCVAKKFERQRPEMKNEDLYNVDAVITTRELAKMIRQANIDFEDLKDSEFDNPMGEATGAAAIFGTTGGVMEAALRTAQDLLTGKDLEEIEFEDVRGEKGIKRATVNVNGKDIRIIVSSGLGNARKVMEMVKNGTAEADFIEVMACPGGCIMGGGQPIKSSKTRRKYDVRKLRADALYTIDEKSTIRKSHQNPVLKEIYKEYLGEPNGHKAHELLHTEYAKREKYC